MINIKTPFYAEILADPPITSQSQDLLKRAPLAEKIAQMLMSFKGNEHFVIGIEGEWGAGKTSFIELVVESIQKNQLDKVDIIKFNPWNFSNSDALYSDFFNQLGDKLGDKKDTSAYVKRLFQKFDKIQLNPSLFGFSLGSVDFHTGEGLDKLRGRINEKLEKRDRKIIIVIDDIDRLDRRETRNIFKLVKVNANFPNVVYLLAYDRPKVEKILTDDGFPGSEYLKKIIQVSFSLPKPETSELHNILFRELDLILESNEVKTITKKYWNEKRWGNLFHAGYKNAFSTIRDIKRYISSWRLDYLILGYKDVNPIDFLGTELIRVMAPVTYDEISSNKKFFTQGFYISGNRDDDNQAKKKFYEELLNSAPEGTREVIDGICRQLFPYIDGIYTNTSYSYESQKEWRKELRVCAIDIFDTYFLLSLPSGGIPQSELESILNSLDSQKKFERNIASYKKTQKLSSIMDRIMDFMDDFNRDQKINLIKALFNIGDDIKDEERGFIEEGAGTKMHRLCYQAIKRIDNEERVSVLIDIVKKTRGLYFPLYLVGSLIQEYEEHKGSNNDKSLLSKDEHSKSLRTILGDKIMKASKKNQLIKSTHLAALLIWWQKWSNNVEHAKTYASNLIRTKNGLFKLLKAFKLTSYSQGLGDYVSVKKYRLDLKGIENLIGKENLENAIKKYSKFTTTSQKELLILFEKARTGKDNW